MDTENKLKEPFSTSFEVVASDLEGEYNHLHHADIFKILEKGRLSYLDHLGIPQTELLADDCFLVLASSSIDFFREIKAEKIECTVKLLSLDNDSTFTLEQELFKAPRRRAVRATFCLVSMSGMTRRKTPLPSNLLDKLTAG